MNPLVTILIVIALIGWGFLRSTPSFLGPAAPRPTIWPSASVSARVKPAATPIPAGPEPETFLVAGPAEGERINEKEVTFRFSGALPGEEGAKISFETKLEGVDQDWVPVYYGNERTVRLPAGPKSYKFLVRAKSPLGNFDRTPASRTFFANLSPYLGKIVIETVNSWFGSENIVIRNLGDSAVEISGWRVRSRAGEIIIPQAVKVFYLGALNLRGPLRLAPGERALIYTGSGSPGENLRLNRCVGYLNKQANVSPSFGSDCPRPEYWEIKNFSRKCQDFIQALGTCEITDPNEPTLIDEPECRQWLTENLNYNACVMRHQFEADFFGNEWRVWLGSGQDMYDAAHDNIVLYDAASQVVDRRDY